MAQRLATEFVKTSLYCTEADFTKLTQCFAEHHIRMQVKVLENGSHEIVLEDESGGEIVLKFQKQADGYRCEGGCFIRNLKLANAMRIVVASFRGDAVMKRIYSNHTIIYYYTQGTVAKIVESANGQQRLIFERKDTAGQLEQLFRRRQIESRIETVRREINELLDLRNVLQRDDETAIIDYRLRKLTHDLFVMEA